jgi:hypothetical protein
MLRPTRGRCEAARGGRGIGDRAARMTNKRRADALLRLLAAHRNGWVEEHHWAEIIRAHLIKRRGLAPAQRTHTDPASAKSLR